MLLWATGAAPISATRQRLRASTPSPSPTTADQKSGRVGGRPARPAYSSSLVDCTSARLVVRASPRLHGDTGEEPTEARLSSVVTVLTADQQTALLTVASPAGRH